MPLITCPDCSSQVSDAAPSCPKCGHPFASVQYNAPQPVVVVQPPKKTSMFTWIVGGSFALCCFSSIIINTVKNATGSGSAPSTTPAAASPGGGGIGNNELHAKVAAMTPADDARRAKLIQEQLNAGTIGHIEWGQHSASMLVGAPFYALDMKDKQNLALFVWISGVRQSKTPAFYILTLTDRKNGQEAGQYDEVSGLVMKR